MDISGLTAKMDFRREIGKNKARTQQTAKGDALKRGKEVVAVLPLTMSSPDTSSVIASAPGSVTLAAAPALLRADNRGTVFPPRREASSGLFQQGAAAKDLANVQSPA